MLNTKIIFYLARHGQTQWNVEQRIQGQLDSDLTEQGKQQALQLGLQCQSMNIKHIFTSPLGRAVETANICGQMLKIIPQEVRGFEERHFGIWQGELVNDIKNEADYYEITCLLSDCKPKQGESANVLLQRFEKALINTLINSKNELSLMIIHGEILRAFMTKVNAAIANKPLNITGYDFPNAQLIGLTYDQKTGAFSKL